MYSTHTYLDPTYFPFKNAGEERVVSLSGASCMSEKKALDRDTPIPPEVEEWVNITEMQYYVQELEESQNVSEKEIYVDESTPIENQIVGYNEVHCKINTL